MPYVDIDEALTHYDALRELIVHNSGGWHDRQALQKLLAICERARGAIDDRAARECIRAVGTYGSDLFSNAASENGAEVLRREILRELDAFNLRLFVIEGTRNAAARSRPAQRSREGRSCHES
jgi:hypothetical protein